LAHKQGDPVDITVSNRIRNGAPPCLLAAVVPIVPIVPVGDGIAYRVAYGSPFGPRRYARSDPGSNRSALCHTYSVRCPVAGGVSDTDRIVDRIADFARSRPVGIVGLDRPGRGFHRPLLVCALVA
jgi:hypothetical protein